MIQRPPKWEDKLYPDLFKKAFASPEMQKLIGHANKEYVYWDKFKHYVPPTGFSIEDTWTFLRFSRKAGSKTTPIKDMQGKPFEFFQTNATNQRLSYIDSNTSGLLKSNLEKPSEAQKNQFILSGISEEAIASSQIEGANTSRKVAKEMILSERRPRNRDEQMIVNNFQVMQRLVAWKDLDLSKKMLLEIQQNITVNTLEDEQDSGRFRKDEDDIQVVDRLTGISVFTPPEEQIFQKELDRLIDFANSSQSDEDFLHPIIKASLLHFWIAYLHPFVDGNGRTARAVFYWYLLKKDYWLFQYLSVSRAIKLARVQYDEAFMKSELDDNDLTYFLMYSLKSIERAIEDFSTHYKKKMEEFSRNELISNKLKQLNERQVALLYSLIEEPTKRIDIQTYKGMHQVAYQTARSDLIKLTNRGLLTQIPDNRKYIYIPNISAIKGLLGL